MQCVFVLYFKIETNVIHKILFANLAEAAGMGKGARDAWISSQASGVRISAATQKLEFTL